MRKHLVKNNSEDLILFFSGWGCDEYEFEHLKSDYDVLILYDYSDLKLDFNFSKYKKIDLIAFSAGVFVASIFKFDFKINKRIAISGNPYLFDEHFGLSKKIQNILYNVTEETANDFAKNYLIKTQEEWNNFHPSKRSLESCKYEFDCLKNIYHNYKKDIKDLYNLAFLGQEDPIFHIQAQKEFYKDRLQVIKNARHNLFFRIKKYEQIFELQQ